MVSRDVDTSDFRALAVRTAKNVSNHDVIGRAAQLSFYFLLALFPFLIVVTTWMGFLAQGGSHLLSNLLSYWRVMLPSSAFRLVAGTLNEVRSKAGGEAFSFGLLATVWAASSGMLATLEGLNRAYLETESRPWWQARLLAIALTMFISILVVIALLIVLAGGHLGEIITGYFGFQEGFLQAWRLIQWPLGIVFVLIAFLVLYRYAPDRSHPRWLQVLPGALAALGLWFLASWLFRVYLSYFGSYGATYGSLGAVIILMLWLYLSGFAVLLGGEVNAELERTKG